MRTIPSFKTGTLKFNNRPTHAKTTVQPNIFIPNRQRHLAFNIDSSLFQLIAKACLISRFQQARSQFTVHLDSRTDYLPR